MVAANQLIANVDGRVRPGTLGEIFNDLANPLRALHQQDIPFAYLALERLQIVRKTNRIVLEGFGEQGGELLDNRLAEAPKRVKYRLCHPLHPLSAL